MDGTLQNKEDTVKTHEGETVLIKDTIEIRGRYYLKSSSNIFIDPITKKYEILSASYRYYIEKDNKLVGVPISANTVEEWSTVYLFPHGEYEPLVTIIDYTEGATSGYILPSLARKYNILEDSNSGQFIYGKNKIDKNKKQYYKFNNTFKRDDLAQKHRIFYGLESPTFTITEGLKKTFGVELETSIGRLFKHDYYDLNTRCVYDGSLKTDDGQDLGGEYVTGVLTGDSGFNQLNKLCQILSKKCEINNKCGVHVHVGVNPSKQFIVHLYKVLTDIEKEIFDMMPKSRRNGSHSRALMKFDSLNAENTNLRTPINYEYFVNKNYFDIYKYLHVEHLEDETGDFDPKKLSKLRVHPYGSKCGYNKDTPRYCWVNLIPTCFIKENMTQYERKNYKDFTVEFRIHSASLNYTKIKNWIKICMAIVHYTENNYISIFEKKVTLSDIIKYTYKKTNGSLLEYVNQRTELFKEHTEQAEQAAEMQSGNLDNIVINKRQLI